MRMTKCWVVLMVLACAPWLAQAADVKLTSSTQYLWYQDLLAVDKEDTLQDLQQYLRVNVTNIDKDNKLNIYGYGRAAKWISTSEDIQGRLYYLFLDYRDVIKERLDLRAGRTYVSAAAMSGTIDGVHLDLKNLGPVGFTFFGGRRVVFADRSEAGTRGDALTGMSVYLDTLKNTHVELSYGRKYADTELARENVGIDISTMPFARTSLYARVKYDISSETYNEVLAGAKFSPLGDLVLRAEYYESVPTFDLASVYSVFAVDQYRELSFAAEYPLTSKYRVSAKYAREAFGNDENADVYQVGFLARPIRNLTLNASYEARNGYAGMLSGIRFYGEYRIDKASIMAGVDYDDFRREASREGFAKKYWAGLNYEYSKIISAHVRIENNVNFDYNNNYQGYAAVQINY